MKTIAIFYEHNTREYQACMMLKNELEKRNDLQAHLFSLHFQMIDAMYLSRKTKIEALVIPYAYKEHSLLPFAQLLRKEPIPYVINLHHEQLSPPFDEPRMLPIDEVTKNRVIHFVWNDTFKNKLIQTGVNERLIYITGNIRSDLYDGVAKRTKEDLATQYGLDKNKKWLLICESWSEVFSQEQIEKRITSGVKKEDLLLCNSEIIKALNTFESQSYELPESFFEKFELIYRMHPGTVDHFNLDKRIKKINTYSVYDWLNVIDANIARNSTTLFESERFGIPSIRYDPTNYPHKLLSEGLENYYAISHLNEINEKLLNNIKKDMSNNKIYEKYLGKCDRECTLRATSSIYELLDNGNDKYSRTEIKIKNRRIFFIRKALSNILSRTIIKNNLKGIGRLSKSLVYFKNDVPPSWK